VTPPQSEVAAEVRDSPISRGPANLGADAAPVKARAHAEPAKSDYFSKPERLQVVNLADPSRLTGSVETHMGYPTAILSLCGRPLKGCVRAHKPLPSCRVCDDARMAIEGFDIGERQYRARLILRGVA